MLLSISVTTPKIMVPKSFLVYHERLKRMEEEWIIIINLTKVENNYKSNA